MDKDSRAQHLLTNSAGMRLSIAVAIIIFGVAACRSIWISLFGVDIPFWDQWAQITTQLAHLKQGTWHYHDYLAPHNEHRILFTRLISAVLFEIDGGVWSNLVEAYVNTVIYSATMALFYVLACRESKQPFRLIMLLVITILGIMPFDWENNLVGFQNQFYIMISFAVMLAGVASYRRPSWSTFWILTVLAAASLFTMASGLFGAIAVCVAITARAWREPLPKFYVPSVISAMMLVIICGLLLLPNVPGDDAFKAHGVVEHARAFATGLIWPLDPFNFRNLLLALLIWCPSVLWAINFVRTKATKDHEIFLVSLAVWVICQDVAIAHARGHNLISIPSRYTDITVIGLVANFALALSLTFHQQLNLSKKCFGYIAISLSVGLISFVFAERTSRDMDEMQQRYDFSRMQVFYTHSYLITRDPAFLQHSSLTIPFPSAEALKNFLDSPTVDSLLPPMPQSMSNGSDETAKHGAGAAIMALDMQKSVSHLLAKMGVNSSSIFFRGVPSDSDLGIKASAIGKCSANSVNNAEFKGDLLHVKPGDPLRLDGWIIKPRNLATRRFYVVLLGSKRYEIEGRPTIKRKDVVRVMHSESRDTYGFRAYGILLNVAPGKYTIRLSTPAGDSQAICDLPYQLVVAS